MNDGYILIHRKIINWQWYSNKNDRLLFIHCLISANWKDGWFNGEKIPRGSFATGRKKLSQEVGLTEQQTRTSLEHLKSTNEITIKSYNKYSIITINNYDKYQLDNQQNNQQITNKQPTNNHNIIKEIKEKKEINNKESISKDIPKKVFIKPSIEEIQEYCNERNNNVDADRFYNFYESKGWMVGSNKMKDWKAAVRTWEQKEDKLPSWWDKDFKERERTEDEERQLQELIRGNKR